MRERTIIARRGHGQADFHAGAITALSLTVWRAANGDFSIVGGKDATTDRQSQTGASLLGGKERFEGMV